MHTPPRTQTLPMTSQNSPHHPKAPKRRETEPRALFYLSALFNAKFHNNSAVPAVALPPPIIHVFKNINMRLPVHITGQFKQGWLGSRHFQRKVILLPPTVKVLVAHPLPAHLLPLFEMSCQKKNGAATAFHCISSGKKPCPTNT